MGWGAGGTGCGSVGRGDLGCMESGLERISANKASWALSFSDNDWARFSRELKSLMLLP